ncbi:MAG: uroporphyrinogen-III synthase [Gammaproteobacteria bacterium]|nr:uroporphyrinogen-III synthase [Gammaproteobacteria bacterium]
MNDAPCVLSGRGILVTRPAHQANALCALIETAGGRALRFPVLDIHPIADLAAVQAGLARLTRPGEYDLAIFVSANAVQYTLAALTPRAWPIAVKIAAIGAATARALAAQGLRVDVAPARDFTSEALLALPEFQSVQNQRILILRGAGGRETLRDVLSARGAQVDYLDVYRRDTATTDASVLLEHWRAGAIDAVLIASTESLQKLLAIIGTLGTALLSATPLIVGNARTRELARSLGLAGPLVVARDATDAAMVDALCAHFAAAQAQ